MRRNKLKNIGISFDEAIANTKTEEIRAIETPINSRVFSIILISTLILVSIIILRLFFLGMVDANVYKNNAISNINKEAYINAPRGIITDRYDKPLVANKRVFSVFLNTTELARHEELGEVIDSVSEILSLKRSDLNEHLKNTAQIGLGSIKIAEDVDRDTVIAIRNLGLNSLTVEEDYKREYLSEALSHVVGYVGAPTKNDIKENPDIKLINSVGKSGLEAYYDEVLRGVNGKKVYVRDATLETKEVNYVSKPQAGTSLKTTIDLEFQEYFHSTLKKYMSLKGQTSGVGIAINPQNGEILSLISMPSFNSDSITKYLNDRDKPLFNRAVSGVYNPGSTIKPVHAVAALKEDVIGKNTSIFSRGYIELPNKYNPDNPSRFVDWKPQGWVDVYSALARSSNVYFYAVGGGLPPNEKDIIDGKYSSDGLGVKGLIKYWKRFGLEDKTGIDLPGEGTSLLPNPTEKEKRTGTPWLVGDTYNVSIGQGDLLITPLQLINTISAIATGGKASRPHINAEISSEKILDISDLESELYETQKGMEDAVYKSYGTAHSLSNLPFRIAGKTGSAQISNNTKTNALFVGYGPVSKKEKPSIAILILVENAKEGSLNTLPIANDVFEWYYNNRLINSN